MKTILHFINGEHVASRDGRTFEKRSPIDDAVIARVAEAGKDEVNAAVAAARQALEGPWGKMPVAKRVELLHAVAKEINRRFDEFLEAEVADTGKPKSLARAVDIPRGAANFEISPTSSRTSPPSSSRPRRPTGAAP